MFEVKSVFIMRYLEAEVGHARLPLGAHRGERFPEIRFFNENYYTRETSGHVPEKMCSKFHCKSDRRSPKSKSPEILAAIKS